VKSFVLANGHRKGCAGGQLVENWGDHCNGFRESLGACGMGERELEIQIKAD
jgi:hypothetical protein